MSTSNQDLETIYTEAIKIHSTEDRARFLDKACSDNHTLRARLEGLIQAQAQAELFFDETAFRTEYYDSNLAEKSTSLDLLPGEFKLHDTIGPYRLMEQVGEGGFGVVWAAEQREPIRQRVALKIIKVGMDTKQVVARFEAERQALALMNHPHIAKVLGAGSTESGRPYFCMELIRGIPITHYCDENKLNTQERLDLFTKVCNAIQHAHQKGVIHRDIKPGNILVTMHDGVPVPKVIDFGIAKAVEMELTEKTIYTQLQQFIGTPAYMSPEQAEMSGLDIDTRSDIYSLGVLLYELLTGKPPFSAKELMQSGLDEMRRMIREKDPERPSMRLSSLQGEERTTAAHRRNLTMPDLIRNLQGDLDWIVIKALEKDRTRRYETSNGLAADIRRHIENKPIVARPPSAAYLFQKAWKRNKGTYTAVTCIFLALLVGAVVSLWQASEASAARDTQRTLRVKAEGSAQLAKLLQTQAEANMEQTKELAEQLRLKSYASDLKAAQVDLDQNNLQRARRLLERHFPQPGQSDLRDLAWRYLWHRARSDESGSLKAHDGNAVSVLYSADGRFMVTMGFDRKTKIWNAANHQLVKTFDSDVVTLHSVEPNTRPFSADGSLFAIIHDKQLRIYDTVHWQIQHDLGEAEHPIIFSKKGRTVSARVDDKILLWDLTNQTEKSIESNPYHRGRPLVWDFSPDGTLLIEGNSVKSPTIWNLDSLSPVMDLNSDYSFNFLFSPSGKYIAEAGCKGYLRLWDAKSGILVSETLATPNSSFFGMAFSPDEKLIATVGNDQLVQLYSVQQLAHIKTLKGHVNEVWKAAFSHDGSQLATAGKEEQIRFWDIEEFWTQDQAPNHGDLPDLGWNSFSVNGDFQLLESQLKDGYNQFWDIKQGRLVPVVRYQTRDGTTTFSKDYSLAATGVRSGALEIFQVPSGNKIQSFQITDATLTPGRFSSDNKLIVIRIQTKNENELAIHDLESNREIVRMKESKHSRTVLQPPFSPDGSLLAAPKDDLSFRLWHVKDQKEIGILKGHRWTLHNCTFSPDGKFLATSAIDGEARIWNIQTMELHVPPLIGHVRGVKRLVWTPDSRVLLTSGDDISLRMWSVALGQEMVRIPNAIGPFLADDVNTLAFVTENQDGEYSYKIIQLPTLKEIDRTPIVTSGSRQN